jgi:hypothetical protein
MLIVWDMTSNADGKKIANPIIARVEPYKVTSRDTLDSIAKANGMTWKQLARFNWGTDVPREINRYLRDRVGCTKKTKDGKNYVFDDSDDPGIVYIPHPWGLSGLACKQVHTIRVRPPGLRSGIDLVVPLEWDIDGDPLQDDEVRLTNVDGEYDRTLLVGDEDVTADAERRLFLYRFRAVPPGAYTVSIRVAEVWYELIRGLVVTPTGARIGSSRLPGTLPDGKPALSDPEPLEPPEPLEADREGHD